MSGMSEACPLCGTPTQEVEVAIAVEPVKKTKSQKKEKAQSTQPVVEVEQKEVSQPMTGGYTILPDDIVMALIECKFCHKKISEKAKKYPNCGMFTHSNLFDNETLGIILFLIVLFSLFLIYII